MKKTLILLISLIIPALCMAQNMSMTSDGKLTYVSNDLDGKVNFPVMDHCNQRIEESPDSLGRKHNRSRQDRIQE